MKVATGDQTDNRNKGVTGRDLTQPDPRSEGQPETTGTPIDNPGETATKKPTSSFASGSAPDRLRPLPTDSVQLPVPGKPAPSLVAQFRQWLALNPLGWGIAGVATALVLVGGWFYRCLRRKTRAARSSVSPAPPSFHFEAEPDVIGDQELIPYAGLTFDIEIYLQPTLDSGQFAISGEGALVQQDISE